MSYWENENAAKQIRNDAELDAEFNDGVKVNIKNVKLNLIKIEKLELNHNFLGVYPNADIYSIIGQPSENGSPERPDEITTAQAFEKTAWSISAYPYRIPGKQMQAYLDLEAKHWGTQNERFSFYQRFKTLNKTDLLIRTSGTLNSCRAAVILCRMWNVII